MKLLHLIQSVHCCRLGAEKAAASGASTGMFQHQIWAEGAVHKKAGSNTLDEAFLVPEFLVC